MSIFEGSIFPIVRGAAFTTFPNSTNKQHRKGRAEKQALIGRAFDSLWQGVHFREPREFWTRHVESDTTDVLNLRPRGKRKARSLSFIGRFVPVSHTFDTEL